MFHGWCFYSIQGGLSIQPHFLCLILALLTWSPWGFSCPVSCLFLMAEILHLPSWSMHQTYPCNDTLCHLQHHRPYAPNTPKSEPGVLWAACPLSSGPMNYTSPLCWHIALHRARTTLYLSKGTSAHCGVSKAS